MSLLRGSIKPIWKENATDIFAFANTLRFSSSLNFFKMRVRKTNRHHFTHLDVPRFFRASTVSHRINLLVFIVIQKNIVWKGVLDV